MSIVTDARNLATGPRGSVETDPNRVRDYMVQGLNLCVQVRNQGFQYVSQAGLVMTVGSLVGLKLVKASGKAMLVVGVVGAAVTLFGHLQAGNAMARCSRAYPGA